MLNMVRDANRLSRLLKRSEAASASTAATIAAHSGPSSSTAVKTSASESENRVSIRGSFIMQLPVTIPRAVSTTQLTPGDGIIVRRDAMRMAVPAAMTVATKTRAGVVRVTTSACGRQGGGSGAQSRTATLLHTR